VLFRSVCIALVAAVNVYLCLTRSSLEAVPVSAPVEIALHSLVLLSL